MAVVIRRWRPPVVANVDVRLVCELANLFGSIKLSRKFMQDTYR